MATTIIIIDGEKFERQDAPETYKPGERYDITNAEAVKAAHKLADYCTSHICEDCMFGVDDGDDCVFFKGGPRCWELPMGF